MKRFHLHLAVDELEKNVRFYSNLFGAEPAVHKSDYAKWMLDDPRVNFAISTRGAKAGLDHLGIQVENDAELEEMHARLIAADATAVEHEDAACCYAQSNKYWVEDPQGIAWEAYHTLASIPVFGRKQLSGSKIDTAASACCAPRGSTR
jgi:catechol 2,3-dioxygenase-like lactoylglutathione lyase family enzyme